jgi:hypothetical protein
MTANGGLVVSFHFVAALRADRFIDMNVGGVFGRHSERSEESHQVTHLQHDDGSSPSSHPSASVAGIEA